MKIFRMVDQRIWDDARFKNLGADGQRFYLRALTHYNLYPLGWLRFSLDDFAADLRISRRKARACMDSVVNAGLARVDGNVLFLCDYVDFAAICACREKSRALKNLCNGLHMLPDCQGGLDMLLAAWGSLEEKSPRLGAEFLEIALERLPGPFWRGNLRLMAAAREAGETGCERKISERKAAENCAKILKKAQKTAAKIENADSFELQTLENATENAREIAKGVGFGPENVKNAAEIDAENCDLGARRERLGQEKGHTPQNCGAKKEKAANSGRGLGKMEREKSANSQNASENEAENGVKAAEICGENGKSLQKKAGQNGENGRQAQGAGAEKPRQPGILPGAGPAENAEEDAGRSRGQPMRKENDDLAPFNEKERERERERESRGAAQVSFIALPCMPPSDRPALRYFHVYESNVQTLQKTFPNMDVRQQLRNLRAWLEKRPQALTVWDAMPVRIMNWLKGEARFREGRGREYGGEAACESGAERDIADIELELVEGRHDPQTD